VAAGEGHAPDWRDAAAYEPLLEADRSLFAWEWLRRNPDYRCAAEQALASSSRDPAGAGDRPEQWGLHAFEPPSAAVPRARPVWRAAVHPYVLGIEAGPPDGDDLFDLGRLGAISTLITAPDGREHLLLSDGIRAIRIDVLSGTIAAGPARLRYRLAGLSAAEAPVLTLRRLLALWRTGRFGRSLHPEDARARRGVLMLRAYDAVAAGANQRAIAAELLGGRAARERWRVEAPSLRSRAQRLVRGARRLAQAGFRDLLR